MRIKPTYDKTIQIRFKRGKDVQITEVIDAKPEECTKFLVDTLSDYLWKPKDKRSQPTNVMVVEMDNVKKVFHIQRFVYKMPGLAFGATYIPVFNLSPREVRVMVEKAINNQNS